MKSLKLEEHERLFESEGYFSDEDVENLKGLTKEDLENMGIKKRGEWQMAIATTSKIYFMPIV